MIRIIFLVLVDLTRIGRQADRQADKILAVFS